MTDREKMKLALEALEDIHPGNMTPMAEEYWGKAITALRQALAEPDMGIDRGAWDDVPDATKWVDELRGGDETEQEPVAWLDKEMDMAYTVNELPDVSGTSFIPLYTAPPKREWVGLTDEEIDYIWGITKPDYEDLFDLPRAIEAKLKEKNT